MAVPVFALVLIKMGFDLVGTNFALVRKIRIPTSRVIGRVGEIDVFSNNRLFETAMKAEAKNLTIAAPEFLDHFLDLEAGSIRYA